MHYFDYAATTPLSNSGSLAMMNQLKEGWFNPSAQHEGGLSLQKEIKSWRNTLCESLGCDSTEFFFTSGGTESNNWAITQGVALGRHRGKHCITSTVEHSSVLKTMKHLEKHGYEVTYIKPNPQGMLDPETVCNAVREDTVFLSLMMVNNETGIIFPVEEIAEKVKKINSKVLVHCDAIQSFLKVPFHMDGGEEHGRLLNIDLLSVSGHKVYGPKGIGGLFVRQGVRLLPMIHGGGQENGQRAGTEPTHQMAAFVAAVEEGTRDYTQRLVALSETKHKVMLGISQIPQVKFHVSDDIPTAPHILSFSLVGYPSQVVVRYLSEKGIYLSAGSACHRGGESHVFASLPLNKKERTSALRVSFSHDTHEEDILALVEGLQSAAKHLIPSF